MRNARLCAAKRPNTTECTAPMRAQASIANTASAMFGIYTTTRSPRCTSRRSSTAAKALTSACSCA
ncbi:hypothetical protein NZ30_03980 [Xanthomonas translucens pv. undulosa]|nr:hypothetical protein FD63_03980 [Xanthomonas translucens pv. undulosa]AVY65556.1 hypothetical protein NZ30_03980 [Xanthomonas translucens pv. undulosa]